jgi:DNA-binding transcriptional LysR family regulator
LIAVQFLLQNERSDLRIVNVRRDPAMKLHYLRYFCVLAEELHFHRAADRLAISQPPLSAAIKALEEELGAQLLRRNSRVVELTSAGAAFLVEAREILERVSRAGDIVRASEEGMGGRLDVGISGSLLYREVPRILEHFQCAMPTVDVVMHEFSSAEQIEKIGRRQLDAGFLHASQVSPPLESLPLNSDQYVLCLPERHPLAGRKSVDLRTFAQERFVMFSREAAPSNHDNVIAIFSNVGIHPRTVHLARTWLTIVGLVAQVGGVALVPRSLSRAQSQGVRFVPFSDAPSVAPALLAWNPSGPSKVLGRFLDSANAVVSALASPGLKAPRQVGARKVAH